MISSETLTLSESDLSHSSDTPVRTHRSFRSGQSNQVNSSHLYLYRAFNNANCNKATAQYQIGKLCVNKMTRFNTQFSGISLLNSVMSLSSSVQFK